MHSVQWHVRVARGGDPACGLRSEAKQRLDGPAGALAGAEFEHLAEQHEHRDDGSGLEVDGGLAAMPRRRRKHFGK